jgi:hypothetical protein
MSVVPVLPIIQIAEPLRKSRLVPIDRYVAGNGPTYGRMENHRLTNPNRPHCTGWWLEQSVHDWFVEKSIEYKIIWEFQSQTWFVEVYNDQAEILIRLRFNT